MAKNYFNATNISFQFDTAENPLIENFSHTFAPGWTALIGANGTGKTTLLKLLCGTVEVQKGSLSSHLLCSYVDQQPEGVPDLLDELIESYDSSAIRYKELLGIEYDWAFRWETLSCGEQKRAQIAAALFQTPDFLAVDEPTNHLDAESAAKVISALNHYRGVGCIVTHDRSLLKEIPHSTLLFMNGITHYNCSWKDALHEHESAQNYREQQYRNIEKQIRKIRSEEVRRRESAGRSKSRLSKQNLSAKDRDGRAKIDAARLTGKDSVDSRIAERLESRRVHLESAQGDTLFTKRYSSGIKLNAPVNHERIVADLPAGEIDLDGFRSLHCCQFTLREGEKAAVIGNSGVGKSTFLRRVISEGIRSREYYYIPQEISASKRSELLRHIAELSASEQGALFTIIKRLGSEPRRLIGSRCPSPGEVRKLLLALAIQREYSLIILDEPTNHLDLLTVRALESALAEFPGALLFVSHDCEFVAAIADRVLHLKSGESEVTVEERFL